MTRARAYRRLSFRLDPAGEDLLVAELWALGTLGLESEIAADGSLRARAYFPLAADLGRLQDRFAGWGERGIELLGADELPDRDWLAEYRRRARPFALGERFWADPGEPGALAPPPGRIALRLPARQAFGTGSHPSTRLAVELLEERPPSGRSLLDIGTGTGVLALVGLHLGAAPVVAIENDPVATIQASQIAALNGVRPWLVCARPEALGGRRFDRIVVNMTLGSLESVLPEVARLLTPGGEALISGALATQLDELGRRVSAVGLAPGASYALEEWVALRAFRAAP